jgi:hypothetical protein
MLQQGDVLIKDAKNGIPAEAKQVEAKGGLVILAEGEATGHMHSIPAAEGAQVLMVGETMYLKTDREVTLSHQEHGPIQVPAGEYEIGIVQEYDHFAEEARQVQD